MNKSNTPRQCPIAIVGMSAIFPGSENKTQFWNNIFQGKDLLTDVPKSHWLIEDYYDPDPKARDKTYGKRGGFMPYVDFDPMAFGMPPNAIESTDTTQLLSLIVAKQVLEDAYRGQFSKADKSRISVVLGTTGATELIADMASRIERPKWLKALREEGLDEARAQAVCDRIAGQYVEWQESSFPGLLANVVAGRIAHRLDLGGTNLITDAACAGSHAALKISLQELYLGHSDLVISGGADALNTISMFMCFSKTPALSMTGDCRPFSEAADGTMLGEGIGMFALKRLDDAERDGDSIYAVINGLGASSDGKGKSVYAPVSEGQASCLHRAYEEAGYGPETVELLEAHGTATKAGDMAEFNGLTKVFKREEKNRAWCALGSIKSNIGHTKAAAGIAGMMKAVFALQHKTLPPSIKIDKPNPKLGIEDSAFYLNTQARPWIRTSDHPRRAGISSFGFGGTNFHVTIEEYLPNTEAEAEAKAKGGSQLAPRSRIFATELFLFSGHSPADLAPASSVDDASFRFVAQQSQRAFDAKHPHRLAIVARDAQDFNTQLSQASKQIASAPQKAFHLPNGCAYGVGPQSGKLAFMFSGQGSQYVNMGIDLAIHFDAARQVFDQCADLDIWDGEPLHERVFPKPVFDQDERHAQQQALKQTEWTQPAVVATSIAQLNIMRRAGVQADGVAGHSLGELSALHAAGVLDSNDTLRTARKRGLLFKDAAATEGAMLAVMTETDAVQAMLDKAGTDVVVANYNSPRQVILSGSVDGISRCQALFEDTGIRVKRLDVSVANHSQLVAPAIPHFRSFLDGVDVRAAELDVFSNFDGQPYPKDADALKQQLSAQIENPVRFVEQIDAMYAAGFRTFIELGPNSVLTGLVGACLDGKEHTAIAVDKAGDEGISRLWQAFARLAAAGHELDLAALLDDYEAIADPAQQPKPKMSVAINGANYGKPYPAPEGMPAPNSHDSKVDKIMKQLEQEQAALDKRAAAIEASQANAASNHSAVHAEQPSLQPRSHAPSQPSPQQLMQASAQAASSVPPAAPAPTPEQPVHPAASPSAAIEPEWLAAIKESQQVMLAAQTQFQTTMAASHKAFMSAAETMMQQQMGVSNTAVTPKVQAASPSPAPAPKPVEMAAPVSSLVDTVPAAPQVAPVNTVSEQPSAPKLAPAPAPVQEPVATPAPAPAQVAAEPAGLDIQSVMLAVVAEKTGYPSEMLTPEMHLENDLGIDSIKRVEILSAVVEQVPNLPELDNNAMAKLSTLDEIVQYIGANMPSGRVAAAVPASASPAPVTTATAPSAAPSPSPSIDIQGVMLAVVAEKTGYPTEMLTPEMHLENDLGIDSIKRVEILSAVVEQVPDLPELDNNAMAKLSTLDEIIQYIGANMPAGGVAPAPSVSAPSAPVSAPDVDVQSVMLEVVAEKTGYPTEMLAPDMHLENDLGIDSIKRVEILSAVVERVPDLPELDNNAMAKLSTLDEIIQYIGANMPAGGVAPAPSVSAPSAPASATISVPGVDVQSVMLEVVADKTGYPTEMLAPDMHLENDLGIDSIKRVEILSAVVERVPDLPELDNNAMAKLSTLDEIIQYIGANMPGASVAPAASVSAPSAPASAPAAAPGVDVQSVMLEVVAEKTGYPTEMLTPEMHLENDLGIDSIKRVEILSAVVEQVPDLPELDNNAMAKLSTLDEIINYIHKALDPQAEATAPVAATAELSEAGASEAPTTNAAPVERFSLRWIEAPVLGFDSHPLNPGDKVVIARDNAGVAEALADRLTTLGFEAQVSENADDASAARAVIYPCGLNHVDTLDEAMQINHDAFAWAQAVAGSFNEQGGMFITVQDTGGQFLTDLEADNLSTYSGANNARALLGGLAGLTKTAAIEWPLAYAKAIDLEQGGRDADALSAIIATEILRGGLEREVGWRANGQRGTLISVAEVAESSEDIGFDANAVVLVSGGARGVTAAALIKLAQRRPLSLVLLGRSALVDEPSYLAGITADAALKQAVLDAAKRNGQTLTPNDLNREVANIVAGREIKATMAELEATGSRVRYESCDIQNDSDVAAIVDTVRNDWGPIQGIIHGAGVIADKRIADKTQVQIDKVIGTKIHGLQALLNATENDPIELMCLFSSVAGRVGNQGQSDYAMANEMLNKLAVSEYVRRNGGCIVKSINWGPWDSGMVNPALKKQFIEAGVPLVSLEDGANRFVTELSASSPEQIEVLIGGRPDGASLLPGDAEAGPHDVRPQPLRIPLSDYSLIEAHSIKGKAVVPFVLVAEWVSRACRSQWPDLHIEALTELNCCKGIGVKSFDAKLELSLQELASPNALKTLQFRLTRGDTVYYTGKVELNEVAPSCSSSLPSLGELAAWPTSDYYDGEILFHQDAFRVIDSVDGSNKQGLQASLALNEHDVAHANMLLMDGGLQLALLWAWRHCAKGTLPLRIARLKQYQGFDGSACRCTVSVKSASERKVVVDLIFQNSAGDIVVEILDAEFIAYFDKAFEQAQ